MLLTKAKVEEKILFIISENLPWYYSSRHEKFVPLKDNLKNQPKSKNVSDLLYSSTLLLNCQGNNSILAPPPHSK